MVHYQFGYIAEKVHLNITAFCQGVERFEQVVQKGALHRPGASRSPSLPGFQRGRGSGLTKLTG